MSRLIPSRIRSWIIPSATGLAFACAFSLAYFSIECADSRRSLCLDLVNTGMQFGTSYLAIIATIFTLITAYADHSPILRRSKALDGFRENTKLTLVLCSILSLAGLLGRIVLSFDNWFLHVILAGAVSFLMPAIIVISARQFISIFVIDKNMAAVQKNNGTKD